MQSNSPCAACKIQRRKCTQECVFAPYFPPDQPQKFVNVHKVFGASNVSKLLQELSADSREDAVNSLAYEADARLRDPVYGCVGLISVLQQRLKQVHIDLITAKQELAAYLGPQNAVPFYPNPYMPHQGNPSSSSSVYNNPYSSIMGAPGGSTSHQLVIREPSQYQQRPVQQNLARFTTAHDPGTGPDDETAEFNEIGSNTSTAVGPGLVLGSGYQHPYDLVQQDQQQQSEHGQNPLQQLQREEDQLLFNNNPESPVLQLGPQTQLWHKFDDEEDRRNNINGPTS
uniref:LOB domain-containing protein n=1 Tax=Cannabis sativa TaxID=3483 RepID=A0A803PF13_CANSA